MSALKETSKQRDDNLLRTLECNKKKGTVGIIFNLPWA